jgi:XTP/dITP diphosphohydrolase
MLVVGTSNPGKLREFEAILGPLGIAFRSVSLEVPEPHATFEQNAADKALAYAAHTGQIAVAEDSGLVVPALGGLPGVLSARFADVELFTGAVLPSGRSRAELDRLNNLRVLELLGPCAASERRAHYRAVLVVARPDAVLFTAEGECHGTIADAPRGAGGFGYDPIFVGEHTAGRTFAEIDPEEKNRYSHRRRALDRLAEWAAGHRSLF